MNNIIDRLRDLWLRLPETWRVHLASAWHTFIGGMLTQLAIDIVAQNYIISFEKAALISLAGAAIRAGVKALLQLLVSWWTNRDK